MSAPEKIRVVVGEDQSFVREGIVSVLQDGGFDVVGTTDNALERSEEHTSELQSPC